MSKRYCVSRNHHLRESCLYSQFEDHAINKFTFRHGQGEFMEYYVDLLVENGYKADPRLIDDYNHQVRETLQMKEKMA